MAAGMGLTKMRAAKALSGLIGMGILTADEANAMYVGAKPTELGAFSSLMDRMVRKEIPDNAAKIKWQQLGDKIGIRQGTKLVDAIDHPALFNEYPLYDITTGKGSTLGYKEVFIAPPRAGASGSGSFAGNEISASPRTQKDAKDIMLHEIQHAIQEKEGWARGGSPNQELVLDLKYKAAQIKEEVDALNAKPNKSKDDWAKLTSLLNELNNKYPPVNADESRWGDLAHKTYRNLAGEIEARDTAARMGMSAAERSRTAPYSSENIPLSDVIVKGATGPQMSLPEGIKIVRTVGKGSNKSIYKVYNEGKYTNKWFTSKSKAQEYIMQGYGKPLVTVGALATELARQGLSPQAAEAARRANLIQQLEGGGLQDAPNPIEYLLPTRLGGGAINLGADLLMRKVF